MLATTRRAALLTLGAAGLWPMLAMRSAVAEGTLRFREIRVDASRLRASAGDPTAAWVEQELPGALAQDLAAYIAPADRNGAILEAQIATISFGQSTAAPGGAGSSQDAIQGAYLVRGPRGIVSNTPLRALASYYPSAVDQALVEEAYHWRVVALAQAFAGRAPKELGL